MSQEGNLMAGKDDDLGVEGEQSEDYDVKFYATASPDRYGILKQYAAENRKFLTQSERILWSGLHALKHCGRFRCQYIIADYIVDFVNLSRRLVIEVDGGYHSELGQQMKDEERTNRLNRLGYTVIRFKNEEIEHDVDAVLDRIVDKIIEIDSAVED